MDLNKVQIIGRVTQDIVLKTTPNGNNVASFSMATNRSWTDSSGARQEQTEFHNIVCWGKFAEIVAKYSGKGKRMYVEGRLETKSWKLEDGTKKNKTEIVCENLILLDGGNSTPENTNIQNQNNTTHVKQASKKVEEELLIEDIPF